MEDKARIRINLNSREIEIEGPEQFIEKYDAIINSYLEHMSNAPEKATVLGGKNSADTQTDGDTPQDQNRYEPKYQSFGEFYSKIPKSAKDVDKILAAGYFVQNSSNDGAFSTKDASKLLIEQHVKLSNASAFMKSNLETRKAFKHEGKYKVSEQGIEYLKKLMELD